MATNKYIEQVKDLLFSFRYYMGYIVVFIASITAVSHLIYFHVLWNYILYRIPVEEYVFPEWYLTVELYLRHFFDCSGAFLFVLWIYSDKIKQFAKNKLVLAYGYVSP